MKAPEKLISPLPKASDIWQDADVSKKFVRIALEEKLIAWDIETSGLDWRSQRIGLCQLWTPRHGLCLVKIRKNVIPPNLVALLNDDSVTKIFHHAMFDLRFLCYHWRTTAASIMCTKIASKLLSPEQPEGHSLATLLEKHLSVTIDKSSRKSDWLSWELSDAQLEYAKSDVVHLSPLMQTLGNALRERGLFELALRCFKHLPTQVELDIRGYKDVYGY